jgi:tRNA nucleotidyltransferase (CCA-adding enzyme)
MSADGSSVKATNRMFDDAISQRDLILLSMSDISPAAFLPGDVKEALYERMRSHREFLEERLKIYNEYMSRPFVSGEDLINAGLEPGEDFSRMLCEAHKLRLSGIPKETVLKHILGKRNRSS